ncbi:putative fatty acid synthase [Tieghemostelium lacteum]|uniref:Putative fatty acid synthase n=1 Tax=Tieghemostelium lacteum TaxID=361077 RepID=A0A152A7K2_TIELA|nr:putative fatty acid synthase [Tieghemostelium lacteum]|eukprot:KYR02223.1 putative fatty acid synthase [Tieghemostelium lacteum]
MTFNSLIDDDIAVVGIGCRFPGESNGPNEFWQNMLQKFDGVIPVNPDRWSKTLAEQEYISNGYGGFLKDEEWKKFDPLFFGISPKEAPTIDPQQRILMTILWEAFEDAHIQPQQLRGSDTGVFIGMMNLDYQRCQFRDMTQIGTYTTTGNATSFIANRLSFSFDLRGPSMVVDSACSSSLNAVYLGCQAIATGDCQMAVVGGVNGIFDPTISMSFSAYGMLGKQGQCRSFDASADGFIRGEGAGVVILKKLSHAIRDGDRVYCLIKGGSSNVDGYNQKTNITQPSKKSQSENIEIALSKSKLSPSDILYVEAHGTGTPVGDPIEVEALADVFKSNHKSDDPLFIGSVKSNMGHLESAAGIASLIKVALMLKHRTLIPNIHYSKPNPKIDFEGWNIKVVTETQSWPTTKLAAMGVNSFGLSGSNCHMILQEYKAPIKENNTLIENSEKEYLVPFSANSKTSLENYLQSITKIGSSLNIKDFIRYQTQSKSHQVQRMVVSSSSINSLSEKKNAVYSQANLTSTISTPNSQPPVVWVFCGQGPQWRDMGSYLYQNNKIFRESIDECDSILSEYFGYSILKKLKSLESEAPDEIHEPQLAQPSIFLVQVGLAELYKSFGVKPQVVVGHSFGEVTSAYYAGIIDLKTACRVVYNRAKLQNLTIGSGRLMSIGIGLTQYQEFLKDNNVSMPNVEIACENSPDSIVITGSQEDMDTMKELLQGQSVFCALLGTPCSFHSSKQEQIRDQVLSELKDLPQSKAPVIPFFSTVTTQLMSKPGFYNAEFIYDNLRSTVLFDKTMSNIYQYLLDSQLLTSKPPIIIELAPHPTLSFYIPKCVPANYPQNLKPVLISPLHKKKDENTQIQLAIGQLYCNGLDIDFVSGQQLNNQENPEWKESLVSIPKYQWDTEEYWEEPLTSKKIKMGPATTLLGKNQHGGNIIYENWIDVKRPAFQFLKGHKIKGKYLFPGSGYIDNLMKCFPNQDLTIYNLEFVNPFFLKEGQQHHLQTQIQPTMTKHEFKVEFFFKDHNQTDQWSKSANGRLGLFSLNYNNTQRDINQLLKECSFATLSKQEVYQKLITLGLPYGETFQRIQKMKIGHLSSLCQLELSETSPLDKHYFFNSSVLDCALHGLIALADAPQEVVFDRLECLKFFQHNMPAENSQENPKFLYVHSRVLKQVGNSTFGSIEIINPIDSKVLISIETVKSTSLIRIKAPAIKYPTKELMTHHWQPKESPLEEISKISVSQPIESGIDMSEFVKDPNVHSYAVSLISNQLSSLFDMKQLLDSQVDLKTLGIDANNINLFKFLVSLVNSSDTSKSFDISKYQKSTELLLLEKKINSIVHLLKSSSNEYISPLTISPTSNQQQNQIEGGASSVDGGSEISSDEEGHPLNSQEVSSYLKLSNPLKIVTQHQESTIQLLVSRLFSQVLSSKNLNKRQLLKVLYFDNQDLFLDQILGKIYSAESHVEIEFTVLYDQSNQVDMESQLKEKAKQFPSSNLSLKSHRIKSIAGLNIETDKLSISSYDLVVLPMITYKLPLVSTFIREVQKLMLPNATLLLVDPPKNNFYYDLVLGDNQSYWLHQGEDVGSAVSKCPLSSDEWKELLQLSGFSSCETNSTGSNVEPLILVAKKENIELSAIPFTIENRAYQTFDRIFYITLNVGEQGSNGFTDIVEQLESQSSFFAKSDVTIVGCDQFLKEHISTVTDKDLIFFCQGLSELTTSNYQQATMDYTKVSQYLLASQLATKFILLTRDCQTVPGSSCSNYLASSLIGTFRYFLEFDSVIDTYCIDIDSKSLESIHISYIMKLLAYKLHGDREYSIRNEQVLVQKIFKNNDLKSDSYESKSNGLYMNLNSNLSFQFKPKEELINDQVEIKVMAAGINYKDNLFYRGLLPQEVFSKGDIYSPPFGLECSGIVSRIGPNVKNFKVGDKVLGFASHSCGSHVITIEDKLVLKPENISYTDAAAIPVVYATSYYSIFHIGCYNSEQESILIHSATGGVGLSSLNLLKWKKQSGNAKIYVSVGSQEKKQYLEDNYGSLIDKIYNSRDMEYSDLLRNQDSKGVDLILNTLSGDYMSANFRALSQVGRIMDLSVTQLVENDALDLGNFKYHVGYQTIDLERATKFNGKLVNKMLVDITQAISEGKLDGIPVKTFPCKDIKTAIEYINERKHIGKIVVDFKDFDTDVLLPELECTNNALSNHSIKKVDYKLKQFNQTLLITGQTGIAIHILRWILEKSTVSNVIVLSRSSLKWELELLINQLAHQKSPVKFHYRQVNVSSKAEIKKAIEDIQASNPEMAPIQSIIHFATVYEYVLPDQITLETIENTHNPKAIGAINLHDLSVELQWPLNNFILFSSVVAVLGGQKQSAYTSANLVLDHLASYRQSIGLPAVSINWGALDAGGVVASDKSVLEFLKSQGILLVSLSKILGGMDLACQNPTEYNFMISNFSLLDLFSTLPTMKRKMGHHLEKLDQLSDQSGGAGAVAGSVQDKVVSIISELLSINPSKLNLDTRLKDYGIDSLLTVQLKNWIDKEFTKNLFTHLQLASSSINNIIQRINSKK